MEKGNKLKFKGFCPVCGQTWKVRNGELVHHGYQRPGFGYIVGDCFGVGKFPHQSSDTTAKAYRDECLIPMVGTCERRLEELKTITHLPGTKYTHRRLIGGLEFYGLDPQAQLMIPRTEYPEPSQAEDGPEYDAWLRQDRLARAWETLHGEQVREWEYRLKSTYMEIQRINDLIATWKFEELVNIQEAETARKAQAAADKQARLDAKLTVLVAKAQKHIDQAVKNRSGRRLCEVIRLNAKRLKKLNADLEILDRPEAVRIEASFASQLMARDCRFDWGKDCEWISNVNDHTLQRAIFEWPAELGGESKKGLKTLALVKAEILRRQQA